MIQALITLSLSAPAWTFVDPTGISHEAINTNHWIGVLSLCGRLRDPTRIIKRAPSRLRVYASPEAPEGVDCMTCLVRRVRLDRMAEDELATSGFAPPTIKIDLRVTL